MKVYDRTWEELAEKAPYYSVISAEQFKPENLSAEGLSSFFQSGRDHLERIMQLVGELCPDFQPRVAVDFGCGVGRVTIPLARLSAKVIAVDVAGQMLREARKNCAERGVENVTFLSTAEFVDAPDASADFVHSFIVLQHIAPRAGYRFIEKLVSILQPDGIGVIHVCFSDGRSRLRRLLSGLKVNLPGAARLHALLSGQSVACPAAHMYTYRLPRVFKVLHEGNCHRLGCRFTLHGKHLGVVLVFQKRVLESL
jgi:ubiquinone/menaquinone biosynthesis C-methylase UbiE